MACTSDYSQQQGSQMSGPHVAREGSL